MQPPLSASHLVTLHGLVTVAAILLYAVTSRAMLQRRAPAAAIGWVLFILLLPYLALPAFLAFGSRKLQRPQKSTAVALHGDGSWAMQTILALGQRPAAFYSGLNLHADGTAAQQALLATIEGATQTLDVCTFILGRDAVGERILRVLCAKARAGVRVRLLIDGLGSMMCAPPDLAPLLEAGGTSAVFAPPFRSPLNGRWNLRDHRKLVLADAALPAGRMWCGGRNLASEYFEGGPDAQPWRDLSFDLSGALVKQAAALFDSDWGFAVNPAAKRAAPQEPLQAAPAAGGAQLVASGPDQSDDTIYQLLVTCAYRATDRIALVTPYFVPDAALLTALVLAARRGVAIDLLIPRRSNHGLSDFVRGRALRSLAAAGVQVWLAPGMLHAKLAVVDDVLALAGSANFDSRSFFLNFELMIAFHEAQDVGRFRAWFDAERASAERYVPDRPGFARDMADGMLLWVAFQL
ncbi:MAG: cardiolipin synthase [Ramlibacter sp.]|nr:cardiolipin synthase [Ramlibacter sp.]